jgi:uncharacterized pyridoxamine 5'-phosphate oxidase family protein
MDSKQDSKDSAVISRAFTFLKNQNTAVIATVEVDGRPNSSVIYFVVDKDMTLHFVTKTTTSKYRNILTNPYVSLCVYDEDQRFTVQAIGKASEVKNGEDQIKVLNRLAKVRHKDDESWLPPITHLKDGKIVLMRVDLSAITMADFANFNSYTQPDVIENIKL